MKDALGSPGGSRKIKTVLVTGATGFLGSYVLPALKKAGFDVVCMVRSEDDAARMMQPGVRTVLGDVRDRASLNAAMKGADAVVHMAAVVKSGDSQIYYDVNQRGTENIVAACAEAGVRRIVHVSTHDVTFERGDYSISKLRGEESVRSSGLDYTIIRPTAIYGKGECALSGLVRTIKSLPVVPIPGGGKNEMQPVYAGDVAAAIVGALSNHKASGKVYFVAGPDKVTFEGLTDMIMGDLGIGKAKLHVPLFAARPMAWACERISGDPFITADSLEMMVRDRVCDHETAAKELGYEPTPLKDGIRKMLGQ